jgi:hypothetical protein
MNNTNQNFETFYVAYIDCLLWSSSYTDADDQEHNFDDYSVYDIGIHSEREQRAQCREFYDKWSEYYTAQGWDHEQAGHDFALTRNGHGAGFWDRGKGKAGDVLTDACEQYQEVYCEIGESGDIGIF